jgi:hypothetical protein
MGDHEHHLSPHDLKHLVHLIMTSLDNLTAAITANTQAVTDLSASVDAAVVDINAGAAGDAQLDALTGAVTANNTNIAAQKARLDAAVAAFTPAPVAVPAPKPTP